MKQKVFFACILAVRVMFPACAQEAVRDRDAEVFAPFVSQLEGEIRNNLIRLSWKDSRDIRGPVYVYRSETAFESLAALPFPAEVPYGAGTYLDEAEYPGVLHYFVVASDEWGQKYILPILNTNTLNITVGPENVIGFADRRAPGTREAPLQPNLPLPGIEGINVLIENDKAVISFSGADSGKNLLLYRSLSPINRQEDLLSALIIRQRVSSPVIDYPLPGINYHYALIYEEDLATGIFSIRPGYNASGAVQIQNTARKSSRDMPLPGLNLYASAGNELTNFISDSLGLNSEAAVPPERLNEKAAKRETEIFPQDLEKGGAGEEYQLRLIVQGYFSMKEWDKAAEEFRRFLDLPRSGENRARAHFYLGQLYYFQKKSREALFEFLSANDIYPADCNSWIQAVLAELTK